MIEKKDSRAIDLLNGRKIRLAINFKTYIQIIYITGTQSSVIYS